MEKTVGRRLEKVGQRNTKGKLIRAGSFVLALGMGPVALLATDTVGASGEGTKSDRRSPTELTAAARAVDPAVVIQAERDKNIALMKYAQENQAREAAEAARQKALHTPGAVVDGRIVYDESLWSDLHHCEQAETWHAGGHFGNGLKSGGNGLGMSAVAWGMAVDFAAERGVTLPSTGWEADIDQQMQAAQIFLENKQNGGGWGWACKPHER